MGEEESPTLGSEEDDKSVARLSFLVSVVSGIDTFSQWTTTDTPDVDVDARSIFGRSTGTLEEGAPTEELCWVGFPLPKEMLANLSLSG